MTSKKYELPFPQNASLGVGKKKNYFKKPVYGVIIKYLISQNVSYRYH